jgi:hypothetical protein
VDNIAGGIKLKRGVSNLVILILIVFKKDAMICSYLELGKLKRGIDD